MKILYLCGDLSLIGGIEKYNNDFLSAIKSHGTVVKVVQRKQGGLISKLSFVVCSIALIVIFRPQHIVCAHLNFSPIVLLMNRLFGFNYSLTLYGIEAMTIHNSFHRLAIERAIKIIVISEYTKGLIAAQFDFADQKYFMLRSSVNKDANPLITNTALIKEKYGFGDELLILTLSRLSSNEEKGQHRVIQAFIEVRKQFPNTKYILAGPGSDVRVDHLLSQNSFVQESVISLGAVTDSQRNELYNLCDVFILPSKNEGFGIVFIEALCCGAQVIASDGFGCREGLLDGKLGLLVDPDDIHSMTKKISQVLSNVERRTLNERQHIRSLTLGEYGYEVWCKKIGSFLLEIGGK